MGQYIEVTNTATKYWAVSCRIRRILHEIVHFELLRFVVKGVQFRYESYADLYS